MCTTPITINKGTPDQMTVGCGRCMPCHLKYCNQWRLRFTIHANFNPIFWCVTLTYDNRHLPTMKHKGKIYQTLYRSHASNFFKTLRNKTKKRYKIPPKISYLICGEYGDRLKRPHYHAIIFGAHPDDILESWNKGLIHFGNSNLDATINYALKYCLKSRLWKTYKIPYERPFINVSKGIGSQVLRIKSRHYVNEIRIDEETGELTEIQVLKTEYYPMVEEQTLQGMKLLLPRYYTKKTGQIIDTEKFRQIQIETDRRHSMEIEKLGLTRNQWNKLYHKYIWEMDKKQHYDNELLTTLPEKLVSLISGNTDLFSKNN